MALVVIILMLVALTAFSCLSLEMFKIGLNVILILSVLCYFNMTTITQHSSMPTAAVSLAGNPSNSQEELIEVVTIQDTQTASTGHNTA